MVINFSILAWRIPWTEEPVGLQSIQGQRVRHDQSDLACTRMNRNTNQSISEAKYLELTVGLSLFLTLHPIHPLT